MNNLSYKVLKDFGDVKAGEIISVETWTPDQVQERISDGTIELIEAPTIPVAIDNAKFQVEVSFKPEATDEEKNSITPFVQDLLKDIEEAEGSEFAIPAHVNALTIRRTN